MLGPVDFIFKGKVHLIKKSFSPTILNEKEVRVAPCLKGLSIHFMTLIFIHLLQHFSNYFKISKQCFYPLRKFYVLCTQLRNKRQSGELTLNILRRYTFKKVLLSKLVITNLTIAENIPSYIDRDFTRTPIPQNFWSYLTPIKNNPLDQFDSMDSTFRVLI